MSTLNVRKFCDYLNRLSDPLNEQKKLPVFWSRTVRDNARAWVDALIMEREGVPDAMIRVLTQSQDRPTGVDLDVLYATFGEPREPR